MKKLVLIALSVIAVSCNGIIGNGYKISGEVKGYPDGTMVFLERQEESAVTGVAGVDTTVVKGGKFVFEGKAEEPLMHRVRFDQLGGFMLILERGDIEVKGIKDSLAVGVANVSGSKTNDELNTYRKDLLKIQKKVAVFEKQNEKPYSEAMAKKDTVTMKKLTEQYKKISEEFNAIKNQYVEKNTDSFLSLLIIQEMFGSQQADIAKTKKYFENLSSDLKETSTGKKIKKHIDEYEKVMQASQPGPKKKVN
ncbi:MAG TPA: DUF4369 domain-containing protein [Flavobacterium sp.]|nr:DUF4369 domain-containing protein [Flavobacterium sp.]